AVRHRQPRRPEAVAASASRQRPHQVLSKKSDWRNRSQPKARTRRSAQFMAPAVISALVELGRCRASTVLIRASSTNNVRRLLQGWRGSNIRGHPMVRNIALGTTITIGMALTAPVALAQQKHHVSYDTPATQT